MDEPWAIHIHKTHHGQKGQHFPPYIIFSNFPWRVHVNDIFLGLPSRIPNYQVMNHTFLRVHHSFVSIQIEIFLKGKFVTLQKWFKKMCHFTKLKLFWLFWPLCQTYYTKTWLPWLSIYNYTCHKQLEMIQEINLIRLKWAYMINLIEKDSSWMSCFGVVTF